MTSYVNKYVIVCIESSSSLLVGVDPPNNVKATVLAAKIIEVSWDPFVSEEVTGYLITYSTTVVYARGDSITVHGNNASKLVLRNLEEDTLYSITIQSISSNKVSGPSNVVSVITWTSSKHAIYVCA